MWTKFNYKDKSTYPETYDTAYGKKRDVYVRVGGILVFGAIFIDNHFEHMFAKTLQQYGYQAELKYSDSVEWKYV